MKNLTKTILTVTSIALATTNAMARPNNYIGIDDGGVVYEINHGGENKINNYDASNPGKVITRDMATQNELNSAVEVTAEGMRTQAYIMMREGSYTKAVELMKTAADLSELNAMINISQNVAIAELQVGFQQGMDSLTEMYTIGGQMQKDIAMNTAGISGVAAIAAMETPDGEGNFLSIGAGHFKGSNSMALGFISKKTDETFKLAASTSGVVSVGFTMNLDTFFGTKELLED